MKFLAWVVLLIGCAGVCAAGDLAGTLAVPHPDHALVYVEGVAGTFPATTVDMDQHNMIFEPYVVAVVKGGTVRFHNSDVVPHQVAGVGADQFNLGTISKGGAREYTFNKPGDVGIVCGLHPDMEAYVLVLENPYFARPDAGGNFRIAGLPPGDYVVKAWYDGKAKKQSVKILESGDAAVKF